MLTGGIKMRYPTKYVLVTDLDDFKSNSSNNLTNGIHSGSSNKNCKENTLNHQQNSGSSSNNCTNPINSCNPDKNKSISSPSTTNPTTTTSSSVPLQSTALISDIDLGNPLNMHIPLKNVTVLPERVWQDCVSSEANVKLQQLQLQQDNNENASGAANKLIWEITNPLQKMTCHCLK